jgi:hypothetical protein
MDGVRPNFLSGEREIIDGNLQLCLACPEYVATRLLLVQTLLAIKKIRPDILPEFKDKLALLQNEKPFTVRGGVSVMATFSLLAARVRSSWLQIHRLISAAWTADVERC